MSLEILYAAMVLSTTTITEGLKDDGVNTDDPAVVHAVHELVDRILKQRYAPTDGELYQVNDMYVDRNL